MMEKGMSKGAETGAPAAAANQPPPASRATLLKVAVCAPSMYTAKGWGGKKS
jgi:hypothetical protein